MTFKQKLDKDMEELDIIWNTVINDIWRLCRRKFTTVDELKTVCEILDNYTRIYRYYCDCSEEHVPKLYEHLRSSPVPGVFWTSGGMVDISLPKKGKGCNNDRKGYPGTADKSADALV